MADPEIVDGENAEQTKKSKGLNTTMVLIIVGVVALLLAVGGALVMISMLAKPQGGTESSEQSESPQKKKDQEVKKPLGELFSFERAIIVNLAETNAERYLKVDLVLELDSPKLLKEIESRLPQIQDLLISITSTKTLDDVSTTSGRNMLRQEMVDKINSLLATGQVSNVYFTEFVVQ